mmetsp:Transcript_3022/g.5690  ORF Transcript_3022/g.5690 Transcript_3022/m.5690 type:complete len:88 (+) Transcript_3022:760-1023(+)
MPSMMIRRRRLPGKLGKPPSYPFSHPEYQLFHDPRDLTMVARRLAAPINLNNNERRARNAAAVWRALRSSSNIFYDGEIRCIFTLQS